MGKKKKIIISFVIVLFLAIITSLFYGANYLVTYAFENQTRTEAQLRGKGQEKIDQRWLSVQHPVIKWHKRAGGTGQNLTAFYYPASKQTKKTIIVSHGYKGSHYSMASYIRMFHYDGYNVLAPDDRGSGVSQGKYVTFGYPDSHDYKSWVDQVIAKNGTGSQIGLFGVSMGGATVMMVSKTKLPQQVKSIVEDCGYDSVENELAYQLKQQFNLPKQPLIALSLFIARFRVGYDFTKGNSVAALKKNDLPLFLIHGANDTFVPTKMVYHNYAATRGPKQLWITPHTKHADSMTNYPRQYQEKVNAFFSKYWH